MKHDDRFTLNYVSILDHAAPHALGPVAAPRVNTSILARAIAIADDAARSDVESFWLASERGVYRPLDENGKPVESLEDADIYVLDRAAYLVDRGLAEFSTDADGHVVIVLRLDLFGADT